MCEAPALTRWKVPEGGVDAGIPCPQQSTVPSVRTPQVNQADNVTLWKVPAGGELWPKLSLPQQATVPSERTPHVWKLPPATLWKVPAGGVA